MRNAECERADGSIDSLIIPTRSVLRHSRRYLHLRFPNPIRMATSRRLLAVQNHITSSSSPSTTSMASPYKSPITSHILDTARGQPAANVRIELHALDAATDAWHRVSHGYTNSDGRVATPLVPEGFVFAPGTYKMVFDTKSYFEQTGVTEYFYPDVSITFLIKHTGQHYHVPLLINPFGYSTYRGS